MAKYSFSQYVIDQVFKVPDLPYLRIGMLIRLLFLDIPGLLVCGSD